MRHTLPKRSLILLAIFHRGCARRAPKARCEDPRQPYGFSESPRPRAHQARQRRQRPIYIRWGFAARQQSLVGRGFMKLANAGDFVANMWNDVPVPLCTIVFMAIGATVATVLCVFTFRDSRLACRNVRFLRL